MYFGIDDNVFFGLAQRINNASPFDEDYYFMRSKSFTDAVFYVGYTTISVGSAAEAVNSFGRAGTLGALALATSETGVGGAGFGVAAASELAAASVMTGISIASARMALRSQDLLLSSSSKLNNTTGYKLRHVSNDILDVMENSGSGHTLKKHVSMTNEELINRAINEVIDATSFHDKSTAIKSVQQNLKKNADIVEEWLKGPKGTLVIEYQHPYSIGYGAKSGSKNITYGLTSSRIVMAKDPTKALEYIIVTAFPIF